jgi:hypothetical protein
MLMTRRRKILLGLLILPAVTAIVALAWPGAGSELAFLVLGVPILVVNAWEFISTDASSSAFDRPRKKPLQADSQEGAFMKSKWIIALMIILSLVFILLVIGYTTARSVVDDVPYSLALYTFLIKLGTKLWLFLSKPVIFISVLAFALLWILATQVLPLLRKGRGNEAARFPEVFQKPLLMASPETDAEAGKTKGKKPDESVSMMDWWISQGTDLKTIQLMLEIDGIELTKPYLISKMETLGIKSEGMPASANKSQVEAYYSGVLEGLYGGLFPMFCTVETNNNDKVASFALKAGMRERLMERLKQGKTPAEPVAI